MLRAAYDEPGTANICLPDGNTATHANILHCIALYRVVDKYDFPGILSITSTIFNQQLREWLESSAKGDHYSRASSAAFCSVVESVYDLPNASRENPLIAALVQITEDCDIVKIFGPSGLDIIVSSRRLTTCIRIWSRSLPSHRTEDHEHRE
jgi:hypothetical protein